MFWVFPQAVNKRGRVHFPGTDLVNCYKKWKSRIERKKKYLSSLTCNRNHCYNAMTFQWLHFLDAAIIYKHIRPLQANHMRLLICKVKFVLFNDATGTHWFLCYHRLLDVIHMVTLTHFLEGNPLPPHRLLFSISSKGSFICTFP